MVAAALMASAGATPVAAEHVARGEIDWACGFGGDHPDDCGIDPVGGGTAVQSEGEPRWTDDVWIDPTEDVLGVSIQGTARAVPVRMLDAHEIVNARIAGLDVAITYCPLCGSGVTFDRNVIVDGTEHRMAFTASGYLFQSDLVMWDDQTGLLWNQITGTAIAVLDDGRVSTDHPEVKLARIPTILSSWEAWKDDHPASLLLQPVRSGYGEVYRGYGESASRCGLGSCGDTGDLHPKEFVVGVEHGDGVSFGRFAVQAAGGAAFHDGVVVAVDSGGAHQTWLADGHTFEPDASGLWVDESGALWDLRQGTRVDDGATLPPTDGLLMFWFAWQEHHPETSLWTPEEGPSGALEVDNGRLPGFTIPIVAGLLLVGALLWRRR